MKKIITIMLVITTILSLSYGFANKVPIDRALAKKVVTQNGEKSYTEPIKITVKKTVKNPEKEFKLLSADKKTLDFIVNKLDDKNYVLIPLVAAPYTLKSSSNIESVSVYEGEIFIGSKENFNKIKKQFKTSSGLGSFLGPLTLEAGSDKEVARNSEQSAVDSASGKTNVQVQGVDEADIVKAVGNRIFYIRDYQIVVAKTNAGKITQEGSIDFGRGFYIEEFYADGNKLVVIGSVEENNKVFTKVLVYDVTSIENPKLLRTMMQEGFYRSSRKIGDQVYLISEAYLYENLVMPVYKDSLVSEKFQSLDVASVRIFPPYWGQSIVTVGTFSAKDKDPVKHLSFMGSSNDVYMNEKSLYISYIEGSYYPAVPFMEGGIGSVAEERASADVIEVTPSDYYVEKTRIKKFSINKSDIKYVGETTIEGTLINQFAMDESNGVFRVAYTRSWSSGSEVATFDKNMNPLGKLAGIAPNERIYSVRFMGDRLYLVTFEQVDPFFVIDLKNPSAPKILGELKIPGYSDYLHPYDANHIIGFGNATEILDGGNVRNDGMKLAMFDVTDVKNPKQISSVVIGSGGTYSELMHNHKALMYNPQKSYFGFPVTIVEKKRNARNSWESEYVFQGGYVYEVDKNYQLKFKGSSTHRFGASDNLEHNIDITRLVYIGDYIYSVSDAAISSNRASDMSKVDFVQWKNGNTLNGVTK